MEIALSKAPDILFDQQIWEFFKSYFDTPEIALERISEPPAVPGGYYHRHGDRLLPTSIKEQDQIIGQARDLGVALLHGFQSLLFQQHVVAAGIPVRGGNEPDREIIPPERWRRLWPHFVGNFAMAFASVNDDLCSRYDDIRLTIEDSKLRSAELTAICSAFLRKRKAEGESRRKILIDQANLELGFQIPVRVFNNACTEVFQRRRGRPATKK